MKKQAMPENAQEQFRQYLPEVVQTTLKQVGEAADAVGIDVYLVGGAVRDMLMRRKVLDIDIVVEGSSMDFVQKMDLPGGGRPVRHRAFDTVKLRLNGLDMDVASARKESYARPGALPLVAPGSIIDDLSRRDFTINSMAICLNKYHFGELLDPFGGKNDLRAKLIRLLHDRSFMDDSTRIFRAIRYEQRLGFNIEQESMLLLKRDVHMIDTISGDRIRNEIYLMLGEKLPEKPVLRAQKLSVFRQIHPALTSSTWLTSSYPKARKVLTKEDLQPVYLTLLLYGLDAEELQELHMRLNFPRAELDLVSKTLQLKRQLKQLGRAGLKPFQIYTLLKGYPPRAVQANVMVTSSPLIRARLYRYLRRWIDVKPLLKGDELVSTGITRGPQIKKYLDLLLEAYLNGEISTRAEAKKLLQYLMKRPRVSGR